MTKLPILVLTPHSSGHVPTDILAEMMGSNVFSRPARQKRLEWMFLEGDLQLSFKADLLAIDNVIL